MLIFKALNKGNRNTFTYGGLHLPIESFAHALPRIEVFHYFHSLDTFRTLAMVRGPLNILQNT